MTFAQRLATALTCCAAIGAGLPVAAAAALRADQHRALQANRYGEATRLPEGGLSFARDAARWTLESGTLRPLEPIDGVVTGFVFEGRGRFQLEVPDPVERRQLDRVTPNHDLQAIDEPFAKMVLRTTDPDLAALLSLGEPAGFSENTLAAERHENWLVHRLHDADARVLCGLGLPDDEYLRAGIHTERLGWLTFDYDPLRTEEVQLSHWDPKTNFEEVWVSLDRAEERLPDGRPSRTLHRLLDLDHVDLTIDLTEPWRRYGRLGFGNIQPRLGQVTAELTFAAIPEGMTALPLELHPWAEVKAVRTADGQELEFVRDAVGERTSRAAGLLPRRRPHGLLREPE